MNQANIAAVVCNRLNEARDEIAMDSLCVYSGTILKHAETVDHEIDLPELQQLAERRRIEGHDGLLTIFRRILLARREAPGHADDREAA